MLGSQHSYHKRLNGCRTVALQQPGKEGFIFFSSNISPLQLLLLPCSAQPAGELVTPRKISRGKKTKKVESSFMLHLRRITTASLLGCGQDRGKMLWQKRAKEYSKEIISFSKNSELQRCWVLDYQVIEHRGTDWGEFLDKVLNLSLILFHSRKKLSYGVIITKLN